MFTTSIFFSSSLVIFSQTSISKYKFGALPLTSEQYAKLPKVNWDTLRKYSNLKTISERSKSIITLVNPPIGDQGDQGSCVGWSVGYTALGILAYPKYSCWDIGKRSPNYVFNQIKLSICNNAYMPDALNLFKQEGSCSWNLMPYDENNCTTQPNSTQENEASYHTASNWYSISPTTSVSQIRDALDLGYPVPVLIPIYQSFFTEVWEGDGIWDSPPYGQFLNYHAVCIVGYDDVQQMFKVQNSWGIGGGDNGFFWITWNLVQNGCLAEAYILYGMNTTYPEYISAPTTLVCSSGVLFTLNNAPAGCTLSWSCSNNLELSSSSGNTATFKAKAGASSTGYTQASVNSCSVPIPQYNVWAGTPIITNQKVDGSSYYPGKQICPGNHWLTVTPIGEGAGNASWTVPPGIQYIVGTNMLDFTFPWSWSSISISARSSNSCGTSTNANFYLTKKTYGCGGYFSMYPNPASDELTITINDPETIIAEDTDISGGVVTKAIPTNPTNYTIHIYNNLGTLVSTTIRTGTSFTIPLGNLRDGSYIIEVSDGKNSCHEQLIIKRK